MPLAQTVLPVRLVRQLKCLCKMFTKFAAEVHTHTHASCSSGSFIVTLSLIQRKGCACYLLVGMQFKNFALIFNPPTVDSVM